MTEIGVFKLESLATDIYNDSLVIFREYIQNSCDAIDKARPKILGADEGSIEIKIAIVARRRRIFKGNY